VRGVLCDKNCREGIKKEVIRGVKCHSELVSESLKMRP